MPNSPTATKRTALKDVGNQPSSHSSESEIVKKNATAETMEERLMRWRMQKRAQNKDSMCKGKGISKGDPNKENLDRASLSCPPNVKVPQKRKAISERDYERRLQSSTRVVHKGVNTTVTVQHVHIACQTEEDHLDQEILRFENGNLKDEIEEIRAALAEVMSENEMLFEKVNELTESLNNQISDAKQMSTMYEIQCTELAELRKDSSGASAPQVNEFAFILSKEEDDAERDDKPPVATFDCGSQTIFDLNDFVIKCQGAIHECQALRFSNEILMQNKKERIHQINLLQRKLKDQKVSHAEEVEHWKELMDNKVKSLNEEMLSGLMSYAEKTKAQRKVIEDQEKKIECLENQIAMEIASAVSPEYEMNIDDKIMGTSSGDSSDSDMCEDNTQYQSDNEKDS
eukprot:Nk52_evm140s226 gene=Nk52_evmTU140s226